MNKKNYFRANHKLFLFSLFVLIGLFFMRPTQAVTNCAGQTQIPKIECEALLALYKSTEGPNWKNKTNWNETDTPCSWYGITCMEGRVVHINLEENRLKGTLPVQLSNLTRLSLLRLGTWFHFEDQNQLTGTLPGRWSRLVNLQELDLSYNQLSGPLPLEWDKLINLTNLYLIGNQLIGTLPARWSKLVNLQNLWLANNQLSGPLPTEWSQLVNLTDLWLSGNQLNGSLPSEWSKLVNLKNLDLDNNQLNGPLLAEWSTLVNLQSLGLSSNQLSGTLPTVWSTLVNLQNLWLANNQLSGPLPVEWNTLINVKDLYLFNNQLSGSLPTAWSTLVKLQNLWLQNNQLSGPLPSEWSTLVELQKLILYSNQLSGPLPTAWSNLANLQWLFLHNNQLSNVLPTEWSKLINLQELYLSNNQLSGSFPIEWNTLVKLRSFWVGSNQLSGEIPIHFAALTKVTGCDVSYNMLTANSTFPIFVNECDPDWRTNQTLPPGNLTATAFTNRVQLNWTPSSYQADGGYYEVGYAKTLSEPYTLQQVSGNKTASSHFVTDLSPNTTYYFVVRTYTPPHSSNQNNLTSVWSEIVQATTTPSQMYSFTVHITGQGSVSSSPTGIDCGADCNEDYAEGTNVTLTATAQTDYTFAGWGGDCRGNTATISVLMDASMQCSASFASPYSLAVTLNGQGRVTSTPAGIDCGTDCSESYPGAMPVVLHAEPAKDFLFNGWGGDCAGQPATATVQVNTAKTCVAEFLALTCQPAVYSSKTQRLSLSQVAIEMYSPLTDQPGQYALCGSQGALPLMLRFTPAQAGFIFQPNQDIGCATQFISPDEHACFARYSAQTQSLILPKVKVTLPDVVFPGDKLLDDAICYRAILQGFQFPTTLIGPGMFMNSGVLTLTEIEEVACQE